MTKKRKCGRVGFLLYVQVTALPPCRFKSCSIFQNCSLIWDITERCLHTMKCFDKIITYLPRDNLVQCSALPTISILRMSCVMADMVNTIMPSYTEPIISNSQTCSLWASLNPYQLYKWWSLLGIQPKSDSRRTFSINFQSQRLVQYHSG